jgi:toxin HigB-1
MIAGFQHKGLKLFYEKGNASKLQPQHVAKIRLILTRLDAAISPGDLNVPGGSFSGLTALTCRTSIICIIIKGG